MFFVSIGVLVASMLFIGKIERRKYCILKYIACFAIFFGVCVLLSWIKNGIISIIPENNENITFFVITYAITVLTHCIIFALSIASMYVIYKVRLTEALFVGSAAYALQSLASGLFSMVMKISGSEYQFNFQDLLQSPLNLFVMLIFFAVVYFFAYFLCIRKYEREDDILSKMWIFLIVINLTNIIMNSASVPPTEEKVADRLYMILLFSRIMLCGSGFAIQFILHKNYRLQFAQVKLSHIMAEQKLQFEIAKENLDKVNMNAHDLRKQISLILQSVENNGGEAIAPRLKDIENELIIADTSFHTGNKALDITLTEKARDCIGKNIKLSAIADGRLIDKMDDLDVYMLFGNLLDNSVEATQQVADEENRIISFTLNKSRECTCVHMENTYKTATEFVNGIPQTIKSDKRFHGFGIQSVKNIVTKYGGTLSMSYSHGMFCVDIIMPD